MQIPAPVSSAFCVPHEAHFVIDQKVWTLSRGRFTINDAQGALLFEVQGRNPLALHTRRVLKDASGNVLLLMKRKAMTMHDRWYTYRGDDESDSNLLFTMVKSSVIQFKPSFDVFLAGNNSDTPDFTVKGDFFHHSYSILYKDVPIAEVSKKISVAFVLMGKDQYGVTVYPGVDQAFIGYIQVDDGTNPVETLCSSDAFVGYMCVSVDEKYQFGVAVHPGVDNAFIGALVVVIDQVKQIEALEIVKRV